MSECGTIIGNHRAQENSRSLQKLTFFEPAVKQIKVAELPTDDESRVRSPNRMLANKKGSIDCAVKPQLKDSLSSKSLLKVNS
jgi:hypothetical protein